MFKVMDYG